MQEQIQGFSLSSQQKRLWLLQKDGQVYQAHCAILVEGNLKKEVLKEALNQIVNSHEIFRTTFHCIHGVKTPIQVINESSFISVSEVYLEEKDVREFDIQKLFDSASQQSLDLEQGSLLLATLVTLTPQKHLLVISLPALCADTPTLNNLVCELSRCYAACLQHEKLSLQPLQYADISEWQNELSQTEELKAEANYWRKFDVFNIGELKLPYSNQLISNSEFKPQSLNLDIPPDLVNKIDVILAQYTNITSYVFFLTCWQILLGQLTGKSDMIIGMASNGRNYEQLQEALGLLVKYLPFQCNLQNNYKFSDLLNKVTEATEEIFECQESFSWEQSLSILDGNSQQQPFFPFCFEFTSLSARYYADSICFSIYKQYACVDKFQVKLSCVRRDDDHIAAEFHYDANVYVVEDIQRLASQFETLLTNLVKNPEGAIASFDILSPVEREQLLVEFNDTKTAASQHQCIHHWFESQCDRTPDNIAVVCKNQQLTYSELNAQANRLAHYLQKMGVGPEIIVGICVERSLDMVVGVLGILKAGGAYLPLDPIYPKERLAFILEETCTPVLLTQEKLLSILPECNAKLCCLDNDWEKIAPESTKNPISKTISDNLAYVIYTSGSTGKPKGTLITHQGLVNYLTWCTQAYAVDLGEGATVHSSLAFDLTITGLFSPLVVGRRVELIPEDQSMESLGDALRNGSNYSLVKITPAQLQLLEKHLSSSEAPGKTRALIIGGENLLAESITFWQNFAPNTILVNEYGPTETVVGCCIYQIPKGEMLSSSVPIGHAIANTELYVLNQYHKPVPIGVPGELYIGGLSLARGYLNRSELTAEKFIPNPFSEQPGTRLYKTGDLVCYRLDGNLEFLGRIDNQVKVRGFRIELGEIEGLLKQYPGVRDTIVMAREDVPGDQRLVAYVVSKSDAIPIHSELRSYLKQHLPEYMLPSTFVLMDALPLTTNGKVDRRALPAPDQTRPEFQETFVAPCTAIEEILAGIWAQILGLEEVGIHDNFFTLGGHSLLATQVISQVRKVFQQELSLRRLFEQPTIAGLAKDIEKATKAGLGLETATIERISRSQHLPLSFAQQRLWFLAQLEPNSPFYNIPATVRLQGQLNLRALQQSFKEILRRHEALRTNFQTVEGQPVAVISSATSLLLPVFDINELSSNQQEASVRQLAEFEAQQPFDLNRDLLLRVKLMCLGEQEHIVLLTMHHIASDGWSTGVLIRELVTLYQAFCEQQQLSPLTELPIQYVDFAAWQRQWLQAEVLQSQISYWKKQLEGTPAVLELPTDHPRPAVQTFQGATYSFELSVERSQALNKFSQQQGSTLFMTLLAAFQTLLWRYTGNEDIVVGSPIANRNRQEIEGLIGFFVNTLVLRTNLAGNPTFEELLTRVREVALGAYAHQDLPFEQLVEQLQPQRDLSYTPLFQVMFVLQNAPMSALELPGLTLSLLESESRTAKFDLTLSLMETAQGLVGILEYNTDLFESSTISRMARHFQTLLEQIVANPQQRVSELALLTPAEKAQLAEWNDTSVEYPQQQCIHQLFESQVERTPDAVAVVFESEQLTYYELNARANQLAQYLQKLGVGPEVLVGICTERSLDMVIGLLGILKAGGAYVPLDPTYPQKRLAFMLSDSQVSVLLTQQRLIEAMPQLQTRVVCLDTDWEVIVSESKENYVDNLTVGNLAYVIYTSGSTGIPKGVMIPHSALTNYTQGAADEYRLDIDDRVLQFASISFDAAAEEIFPCLVRGGTLVLRTDAMLSSVPVFLQKCSELELTMLDLPTAFWHEVTLALVTEGCILPKQLRLMLIGGEKALKVQLATWHKHAPKSVRLVNTYGPTETTIVASKCDLSESSWQEVPIGSAIPNVQTYVLDNYLQPVPIGVVGELYIGGVSVARGYLNRPDLTADKFIPNPYSQESAARLYKTGDLVRYFSDGNLEIIGRIDQQVKVRGFRIELGEIEALLSQYPTVRETVVVVRSDEIASQRIVAYVVPQKEQTLTVTELRGFIESKLPNYMVPAAFVMLESLPLTPNGKVDRQTLPIPDRIRPELEKAFIAPQTTIEKQLAVIWEKVLGLEKIGINDNFFELGGDSILSLQIISKANLAGLQLTPKQLFQHQTVAQLAAVAGTTKTIQAEQIAVTGTLPLTPIQQWFFEQQQPEPDHWNQAVLLEIKQSIELVVLEQVIQFLQRHHDALRLRFLQEEFGTQAVILSPDNVVPITYLDLSALPKEEQAATIERMAAKLQASLNLSVGPLFRVALFDLGEGKLCRLLWAIHHLAVDGVSWRILLEDFQTAYQQLCQGKKIQLPAKTTSFKEWSHRLQEYAQSSVLDSELEYWLISERQSIKPIPVDYQCGNNTEATACTVSVSLSEEETQVLLQQVPTAYRTQINDILLTALTQTFAQWTGENSLLIDLEGHGREELFEDVDLSRTVGWFTSIFPVNLSLENATSPGKALMAIKEQLRAIPNRGIGYGVLHYLSRDKEITSRLSLLPKAEVIFNYLGQFDQVLPESSLFRYAQESSGPSHSLCSLQTHLLEINGSIFQGRLQMNWTYNEKLHRQTTVERLAQGFIQGVRSLIAHCQSPDVGSFSPSDFADVELSQEKLDNALAEIDFF
ncbi:amino acid adenylation domain-containing protein [Nostoc sp.]|uniref:amino acid adenylation domain-containing protein n=1 Tax=Nostoc sp. TaxID=1180 RepID=UPI003B5D27F4